MMSKKQITTAAFPEPNYTQTPNDFFAMLPDMEDSEVRVTLVMIRNTFGYHKDGFKMGLQKLADAAGLSRNAAKDGAEAAEIRGTFRRTNPDSLKEAEWELIVQGGQPVTTPEQEGGQPVTTDPSTSDQQVGVKENIKEIKPIKEKEHGADAPETSRQTNELPLEWQILSETDITAIPDNDDARRKDAANIIAIGMGQKSREAYALAYEFMDARKIIIPEGSLKGQRKPINDMLQLKVKPNHVREAVATLTEKKLTVTDLHSVSKTAIALANPPGAKHATNQSSPQTDPEQDRRDRETAERIKARRAAQASL